MTIPQGFQRAKLEDFRELPSARLLEEMHRQDMSFFELGLWMSRMHRDYFRELYPPNPGRLAELRAEADHSLAEQRAIESKDTCSGATNHSIPSPKRRIAKATSAIIKLPAGPAAAMTAARPGYRRAQVGSYGQLAHPIAQPCVRDVSSGSASMPIGSRAMCGAGLRET